MDITNVKIFKFEPREGNRSRAVATVTFDDCFVVKDIRVIEGEGGKLIVGMPAKKVKEEWKDIAHPINSEFRQRLTSAVIEAYEKA